MSRGKELTVKQAMIHMLWGNKCDVVYTNKATTTICWNDKRERVEFCGTNEAKGIGYEMGYNDTKYYIHVNIPELLEGVGKWFIQKSNNNVQVPLKHGDGMYFFFYDSRGYTTYEEVLKEWHPVEIKTGD